MRIAFLSPLVLLLALVLTVSGCRTNQVARVYQPAGKQLPPGQAKKVYGHQSAKAFAPGQQKKNKYYAPGNSGQKVNPGYGKKKGKKK
ncbi:hypothetical protein [Adhaeribacter rhizoryzae]|uniref:hypothetical protein n=1 Tax=Adhaeribacter rhizoryzae TaxID=2607907 RepID=UPI001CC1FD5E|nr:hypothetical protein [Adhaeribacter rhizoryzae]